MIFFEKKKVLYAKCSSFSFNFETENSVKNKFYRVSIVSKKKLLNNRNIRIYIYWALKKFLQNNFCINITLTDITFGRKLILVPIISLKASLMYSNTNETRSRKIYFILTRERFLFRFFVRNLISQSIIRYLHKLQTWTWSSIFYLYFIFQPIAVGNEIYQIYYLEWLI